MVLYRYSVSFFRPAGEKTIQKELKLDRPMHMGERRDVKERLAELL
jgi:hypothetical protein